MRRLSTLPVLLACAVVAAACGGDTEATDGGNEPAEAAASPSADLSCYIARGTAAEALERPSPLRETEFSYGGHDGLLCYGAPAARGREIMGGLLVYGQLERIGANEPTTLHLAGPASVGGVEVGPGSYSLYAIPGPDEWVFFLNSNWERWGIPISDEVRATEVGTFTVETEETDQYVESLQYRWEPMTGDSMGDMVLEWENTRVRFHIMAAAGQ